MLGYVEPDGKLVNLPSPALTPVVGSLGKELFVVPGKWARISNISDDGKLIQAETFKWARAKFV